MKTSSNFISEVDKLNKLADDTSVSMPDRIISLCRLY